MLIKSLHCTGKSVPQDRGGKNSWTLGGNYPSANPDSGVSVAEVTVEVNVPVRARRNGRCRASVWA